MYGRGVEAIEKQALQSGKQNGKIGKTRFSKRSELKSGRREEDRDKFIRRSLEKGYTIYEGKKTVYRSRHIEGQYAKRNAKLAQKELERLGVKALIIDDEEAYNKSKTD